MYAVILAGGKANPENNLWAESGKLPKALINICGKPMIQWVIDALNKAESVDKLIVAGLIEAAGLESEKPVLYLPDAGGIFKNLAAAVTQINMEAPGTEYFLSVSADIPLITPKIVDAIIERDKEPGIDVFYNVVEKKVMEVAFPGVRRTYMRFCDGSFCGADIHVMNTKSIEKLIALEFEQFRKHPLKLMRIVGFDSVILMLLFPPTLEKGGKIVNKRTGISGNPIVCDLPEIAMDVDTLEHLEIVRDKLAERISNE